MLVAGGFCPEQCGIAEKAQDSSRVKPPLALNFLTGFSFSLLLKQLKISSHGVSMRIKCSNRHTVPCMWGLLLELWGRKCGNSSQLLGSKKLVPVLVLELCGLQIKDGHLGGPQLALSQQED